MTKYADRIAEQTGTTELGVRSLLLNTYVGGTSPSTRPHMHYYAGLAYGTEYIGPMKGV